MDKWQKFKKKPVIISAFQFNFEDALKLSDEQTDGFVNPRGSPIKSVQINFVSFHHTHNPLTHTNRFTIHTLEGDLNISDGDFIIEGVNGEHYPCKPDIFDKTYEKVIE